MLLYIEQLDFPWCIKKESIPSNMRKKRKEKSPHYSVLFIVCVALAAVNLKQKLESFIMPNLERNPEMCQMNTNTYVLQAKKIVSLKTSCKTMGK